MEHELKTQLTTLATTVSSTSSTSSTATATTSNNSEMAIDADNAALNAVSDGI